MLDTFVLFVYGWIVGTIAVPLCYLYGLENLMWLVQYSNRVLLSLYVRLSGCDVALTRLRRANYQESALSYTSMSTLDTVELAPPLPEEIGVSSVLHTTVCRISYPRAGKVVGAVYDCRLVLNDRYLLVYQVQNSEGVGSHERVITAERLQGRVRIDRIVVQPSFLPHSGRHEAKARALHGHVLHIRACDDGPLFEGDRDVLEDSMSDPFRSSVSGGSASRGRAKHSKGSVVGSSAVMGSTTSPGSVDSDADRLSDTTHTFVVKFYYLWEQERWQTLLGAPQEVAHWRAYLRTVTTPDSFNLLLTRLLRQNMRMTALTNFIGLKLQKNFDELSVNKFPRELGGRILLDDFLIGEEVPIFSNVSSPKLVANGEMIFDFDVLYRGGATLCLRLNLTYRGFRIPHVVLSIKVIHLSARVRVSVGPPPSKVFWLGGLSPPDLRVEMHQGIQSGRGLLHRILTSLPDLSSIATNLIKLYLLHDMGLPALDDFPLPSIEKTPPSSPQGARRKTWDIGFNRHNAAAHSRCHVKATPVRPASEAAVESAAANDLEDKTRSVSARLGCTTPSASGVNAPSSGVLDVSQIAWDDENITGDVSAAITATPTPAHGGSCINSVAVAPSSSLPPNSEDGRRLRLKSKARELMRKAVKRVTGMPGVSAGGFL
ncbi:hypothetical protein TRSC58_05253 [Trypanosoma rangeli SC58]|uniref:SMP-LTD domain-containing protein n=1 Tax=Trypanosoma rangeli SC58 TaxID=429131 RepID=A0A061IWP8_TRYRA|nr:hypothetical protein TRSC58_05253 [Trypanosoma rangeli SC58]